MLNLLQAGDGLSRRSSARCAKMPAGLAYNDFGDDLTAIAPRRSAAAGLEDAVRLETEASDEKPTSMLPPLPSPPPPSSPPPAPPPPLLLPPRRRRRRCHLRRLRRRRLPWSSGQNNYIADMVTPPLQGEGRVAARRCIFRRTIVYRHHRHHRRHHRRHRRHLPPSPPPLPPACADIFEPTWCTYFRTNGHADAPVWATAAHLRYRHRHRLHHHRLASTSATTIA